MSPFFTDGAVKGADRLTGQSLVPLTQRVLREFSE